MNIRKDDWRWEEERIVKVREQKIGKRRKEKNRKSIVYNI